MKIRERLIKALSPKPAPKAHWNAGRANRAFGTVVANSGPNQSDLPYLFMLRARVRDMVRNAPAAAAAIDILVSEMIGTGIVPLPIAKTSDVKNELSGLWRDWEDYADFDGLTDVYGLQAAAARAWKESGECFVRLVAVPYDGSGVVPLRLQLLEADMIPLANGKAPDTGNEILQGIEFQDGQRVAYWVFKKHPGDFPLSAGYFSDTHGTYDKGRLLRVPAGEILHIYKPTRPGQLRGVPLLSGVLQTIAQLKDFDEATIERQKHAAALTFFIRRPAPLDPGKDPVTGEDIDPTVVPSSTITAGSAYTLLPGEEIESPDLPELGKDYEAFTKRHDRMIAAAAGVPYELLTGDFRDVNDRTARVALGAFRRKLQQDQWGVVVHQLCRPIWQRFIALAVLNGLTGTALAKVRVRWSPQAWPYINPLQDVQAQEKAISAGLVSRTATIMERGDDPEQVDNERADDMQREQSLGLSQGDQ
jgi:lambda family phage portal protein